MKILEQTSTTLSLKDTAGCMWLFGFFFIAIAGTFVVGLAGLFTNLHEVSELEKLFGWAISLTGVAAGLWIVYAHPGVYVNFDKSTGAATIKRKGFLKNETETYTLKEIKDIVLIETADSDGDPFYQIALMLYTEKQILLFSTGLHDKNTQQKNVDMIKRFLEK